MRNFSFSDMKSRRLIIYHVLLQACAVLLLLGACSTANRSVNVQFLDDDISSRLIRNVPFHAQEKYQCGPSSLAGVLNYYGENVSPKQIAGEIFAEEVRGTLSIDLAFFARARGLDAVWYEGSPEDLQRNIDRKQPLIAMVDLGLGTVRRPHYLVVVGYGPEGIIANTGTRQQHTISWNRFLKQWDRTQMWTLRIHPKVHENR